MSAAHRKQDIAVGAVPDAEGLRARLADYLGGRDQVPVAVGPLRQFPVGFSWLTYGATLSRSGVGSEIILRLGPQNGLFAPYSAAPQFLALEALAGSEVPVPAVYAWSDDSAILGAPFFVSQKVAGATPVPWGRGGDADPAWRAAIATDFIDALAALHRFDWRASALASWGEGMTPANAALRQVAAWEEKYRGWALRSYPMLHRAFAWLKARPPVAARIAVVHGDYRLGNFLEVGGRISAILDWELVHLGDPVEDLGWAMLPQYRGGTGLVCQLASEEEFLRRYEAGAGYAVDPAALRFYRVFSLVKLAATHIAASRCFEDGRFSDLRMPAMATQIAPVLRQIEKLLEAQS